MININRLPAHLQPQLLRLKTEPAIFVQFDTTSTHPNREISRICIFADNALAYSQVFKVSDDEVLIYNHHVAEATGISEDDLNGATLTLEDEVDTIMDMLTGKLIICNDKEFLLDTLSANDISLNADDILDVRETARAIMHKTKGGWEFVLKTFGIDYQDDMTTLTRGFCMYQAASKLKNMLK